MKKELNQSSEEEGIFHIIKELEHYANKFNYINNFIVVIDLGSYLGTYMILLGKLNFKQNVCGIIMEENDKSIGK